MAGQLGGNCGNPGERQRAQNSVASAKIQEMGVMGIQEGGHQDPAIVEKSSLPSRVRASLADSGALNKSREVRRKSWVGPGMQKEPLGMRSGRRRREIQMELPKGKAEMWNWNLGQQSPSKILNSSMEQWWWKQWSRRSPMSEPPCQWAEGKETQECSAHRSRERDILFCFSFAKNAFIEHSKVKNAKSQSSSHGFLMWLQILLLWNLALLHVAQSTSVCVHVCVCFLRTLRALQGRRDNPL